MRKEHAQAAETAAGMVRSYMHAAVAESVAEALALGATSRAGPSPLATPVVSHQPLRVSPGLLEGTVEVGVNLAEAPAGAPPSNKVRERG